MRHALMTIRPALVLVALLSQSAAAQDLFRVPGNPQLVPADISVPDGATLLGEDDAGYVYYAQGQLFCHHRDDPATYYLLPEQSFFDANGTRIRSELFGLITPDRSGIDVAFAAGTAEAVRLFRVRCQDLMPGGAGATQLGGTILRSDNVLLANIRSADFVRLASGAWCFTASAPDGTVTDPTSPAGIICVDPVTPPTFTQLVDAGTFDEALDVDPALVASSTISGVPPTYESWTLSAPIMAPGERLFFFADRRYTTGGTSPSTQVWRYVVERTADGALVTRVGPAAVSSGAWGMLSGSGDLVYSAELDALITQVVNQEHNWEAYQDIVATGFTGATWGWSGVGLRVIPLAAPGSGYLPLSRVVAQRHGCTDHLPYCGQLGQVSLFARGAETLITITRLTDNPNLPAYDTYVLELDHDDLDLDDDGLSAAEEAAAGTWDTVPDSDFGGTPDGVEVDFAHSDPLDSEAEPARLAGVRGAIRYALSPLIGRHLGVNGSQIRIERPRTVGIDNPMCVGGDCYGPDGLVASYPVERRIGGSSSVIAADGSFIMLRTTEGLVRFYFEDAREELAVTAADLDAYVPTWTPSDSSLTVIPIDATRTLLASDGKIEATRYPAVVALAEGDAISEQPGGRGELSHRITILYDHAQAQRDSGLSVAEDDFFSPLDAGVMASIAIIGWNADTERLYIGVRGNWDTWLVAVGLDGTAKVLGRGRALKGLNALGPGGFATSLYPPPLPAYLLPTGHGDYFASGAVMEPFGGYLPAHSTLISNMEMPPLALWGDVLLETVCCGFNEDGLYELVRYERTVEPGDVLLLQYLAGATPGAMLYRSGPRGGLAELWDAPLSGVVDIGGIDLAPDGSMRLCIADRGGDVVWELEPAGPDGPPEIIRYSADVPEIRDCAYDAEGNLSVLALGPARVAVRSGDFGDLAVTQMLPSAPEPLDLLRKPDGASEVRVRDGLRGKAYLPDGRVVTMRDDDMVLRVDDVPLPLGDFGERLVYQSADIDYGPAHPARVALAIRPDGSIVVAPFDGEAREPYALIGRVSVISQGSEGYAGALGVGDYFAHEGLGLTVVPGGSSADPWTGRVAKFDPPSAASVPAGSSAAADPESPASPGGGGCSGGALPSLLLGLLALGGRLLARRLPARDRALCRARRRAARGDPLARRGEGDLERGEVRR